MVWSIFHSHCFRRHLFLRAQYLTQSRSEIDENGANEITQHLINRFVDLVNEGEQALVVRKLASSLVAILRHPATPMKQAVLQLAASLAHGEFVSEELVQGVDFEERILPRLNQHASGALLFFSIALAEEALRMDSEPQAGAGQTSTLQRAILNMKDGLTFVQFILRNTMLIARTAGEDVVSVDLAAEAMSSWKVRYRNRSPNLQFLDTNLLTNHIIDMARFPRNPSARSHRRGQRTRHQLREDCHRDTPGTLLKRIRSFYPDPCL